MGVCYEARGSLGCCLLEMLCDDIEGRKDQRYSARVSGMLLQVGAPESLLNPETSNKPRRRRTNDYYLHTASM